MKTPEESLGISSEEYNKIVDECIYGDDRSTWSKEDDVMLHDILRCLPAKSRPEYNQRRVDWLKSLKERIRRV